MEKLLVEGETILKENVEVEAESVLTSYKEFLLIFYGAGWSAKSH